MLLLIGAVGVVMAGRLSAPFVHAAVNPSSVQTTFPCVPVEVGVFIQRVHVRCTTTANVGGNVISWWSYPASDSARASGF